MTTPIALILLQAGTIGISTIVALLAIAVLLAMSAAMSASELAMFSLTPTQLRGTSGQRVLDLLSRPRRLLATVLVMNSFGVVGITVLSNIVVHGLFDLEHMPGYLVFIVQVVAITFIVLLLGEVLPKVYAASHAMSVAQLMSGPLIALRWFWSPVNETLIRSTSFIEKRFKKRGTGSISMDSLGHALDLTHKDVSTTAEEQKILRGIVKFGNIEVTQVMRARTEMTAFDKDLTFLELQAAIIEGGFSRVPVYDGSADRVMGVLHIKDVLPHIEEPDFEWRTLLLDNLLLEFQKKKVHLAVVVDEYGGTSGIVTLEDVIEEIVGDITDEYDDEDLLYSKLDDRTWVFEGKAPISDVYRVLGTDGKVFEDNKGQSETLGGFILELMGRIPQKGERVDLRNWTFTVESSDNKRVRRVKVQMKEEANKV